MPPPRPLRPAAQYLRRSTGSQTFSLDQQAEAIAAYAADRGFRIVRSFLDHGSGLDLAGRPGLQALLAEALGPAPGFEAILVYDVSRWGRFQDLDQGAHYEFLCRRAGLAVEYCVEPFDNDGSPMAVLVKQVKRSMAAEYSRQLSDRIGAAKRRAAALGFVQTGRTPFGLVRQAVDTAGRPRALLARGERRAEGPYRTTLVPGPEAEVAAVRRIFRLYVVTGLRPDAIADQLRAEPLDPAPARAWTPVSVRRILRNEAYVGTLVYGRRASHLKRPLPRPPPETWIRVENAFPALVSRPVFEAAQGLLARGWTRRRSEAELLDDLRDLLARRGRLDTGVVDLDPATLSAATYAARLGGLKRAYALIGYDRRTGRAGPRR